MTGTNNAVNNSTLVTKFTASGTWNKSPRTKSVDVYLWSGGNGGGSGRSGASGSSCGGSGGAGGQAIYWSNLNPSVFASSETITIGGTANGALGQTNGNGTDGAVANDSSIGTKLVSSVTWRQSSTGANNGKGGTTSAASGSSGSGAIVNGIHGLIPSVLTTTLNSSANYSANGGGSGAATNATSPTAASSIYLIQPSGGAQGPKYTTLTALPGAAGGTSVDFSGSILLAGGSAGAITVNTDGGNGTDASTVAATTALVLAGTGGGSGGISADATPIIGKGGNGGIPGGGGGGGSGSPAAQASGAGGTGARGEIWIIEHF